MKKLYIFLMMLNSGHFSNAQNVGIGTSAPAAKLHIQDGISGVEPNYANLILERGIGNNYLRFLTAESYESAVLFHKPSLLVPDGIFFNNPSNPNGYFFRNNNAISMTIRNNGNVGIGITNPVFKLDVRNGGINTDGVYSIGTIAVLSVSGFNNLFVGRYAGRINSGSYNVFSGNETGYNNTSGIYNSFFGNSTGHQNNTGNYNSFFGNDAGFLTTSGTQNSFFGSSAGYYNTTGTSNTALGHQAGFGPGDLTNATAIGYTATVNASNNVSIGNIYVTSIGGWVDWSKFSDGRFKQQVQEDIPGLAFIKKLRTVSYQVDFTALNNYYSAGKSGIDNISSLQQNTITQSPESRQSGFIAQEVEQAAKELGFSFSGVDKPQNEKALYGLRYGEFVVPLVKAVQEQQLIIESLQKQVEAAKAEIPVQIGKQQVMNEQQNTIIEQQNKKIEMLMKEINMIKEKLK